MNTTTTTTLIHGDAFESLKTLPDKSVHTVVTSPPYWGGLRNYDCVGQLGYEATPAEHIARMVEIATEIKRVLHPHGTLWWNYGDCYATGGGKAKIAGGDRWGKRNAHEGLKPKDMVGMPWELAFAFRNIGFWLRTDIIWNKTNALTTSASDRCPTTHEYIFMLTRAERYYFDRDAIREKTGNEASWDEYLSADGRTHFHEDDERAGMLQEKNPGFKVLTHPLGRAVRTIWDIPTERSFRTRDGKKHYAAFPKAIPERCIKAGTSEAGCCPKCLNPWIRQYETHEIQYDQGKRSRADAPGSVLSAKSSLRTGIIKVGKPIGWRANCKCVAHDPIPCTVLDPFNGSGTTALVAARLMRNYIGIELSPIYLAMTLERMEDEMRLFNRVEVRNLDQTPAPF